MRLYERLSDRTWNSKSFVNSFGEIEREFRIKWIHYLDSDDTFKDIDVSLVDNGTHFGIVGAPFQVKIPKSSIGTAEFISDNRWDIFEKKKITDPPFTQTIRALGINDVAGVRETGNLGFGQVEYVVYPDAYPKADLIYWVSHGKAPRLKKLVRFREDPLVTQDVRLEFELSYSSDCEIKYYKEALTAVDEARIKDHLKKARDVEKLKLRSKFAEIYRRIGGP